MTKNSPSSSSSPPSPDDPFCRNAAQGAAIFRILFEEALPGKVPEHELPFRERRRFLLLLRDALQLICEYGENGSGRNAAAENLPCLLNTLAETCAGEESFRRTLDEAILDALIPRTGHAFRSRGSHNNNSSSTAAAGESTGNGTKEDEDLAFYLSHAKHLVQILSDLLPAFCGSLPEGIRLLIRPSALKMHSGGSLFLKWQDGAILQELRSRVSRKGEFGHGRVYRYRGGEFKELELKGIRAVDEFYGYHAARETFLEHFREFSEGKGNLPLLISSLPGLGKTQMTISHSLYFQNIVLILPEAGDIAQGLEELIRKLAAHPDKKFMVFFDDIDNLHTDWYYFRANIGGTFQLPPNISITISSNQDFPANISSRGRGFAFPIFDEIRCQEMVEDFLLSKGMRNPPPELVSVIASDYVEEFGQKKFEELSPRTLVRYLHVYRNDERKRKRMLELSRGEIITRPDAQVFYEENVKLLRSIYGEKASEEMKRRLSGGEGGGNGNGNGSGNEK